MADYSIQLGVTVDTSGVQSQINRIKPDPIELDVQVNTRTLQTQINNIRTTPVEVNVRLNDANALAQIANIRQQLQNLNNINVNIGGNGRGGGRRQVDDVTQAYRDLMGVLGELNSKRLNLNGLTASSPQSSQKIQTLRLQIEQLENEYNNLINSFNAQGIQFTADQWNELETTMARVGRQIDVVQAGMSDKTAINNQTQAYRELLSVAKEINNLEINITKLRGQGGNTNQIAELENQLNTLRATYQQLVTTMDTPLTNEQWSSIYTQVAQTSDKLEQLRAKIADAQADVAKGINIKLNDGSFNNDLSNITGRFDRIKEKTQEVKAAFDGFKTALSSMQTAADNNDIEGLIKANQDYERALKAVKNQLDINERAQRASIDSDKLEQAKNKLSLEMSQWIKDNSAAVSQFGGKVQALQAQIQSADGVTLNNLKSQFTNVKKEAELAGKTGQTFGTKIKEKFSQFSAYFSVASVFMYATQAMKSMFEQVKSIDTAMTELKKVTDETDATYDQFLTNAASKAKEIGTTIDGLVTSTADFARLGYDFDQAVGLAEVANIYTVVGDEINGVEDATESLISTMAAFKSEMGDMSDAEFALSIVDKFNEVDILAS